jgi:Transposase DDE domain
LAWTGWIGVIGGIATVAAAIEEDLRGRLPAQHKKQRAGLALLAATMLDVRSANLMDLAASLPRAAERLDMRYQWISRLLGNPRIGVEAVMAPYVREVLARLAADGRRVVLMIDQSQASERHQVVMVAARIGGRALPLAWRVKATQGAIGFAEQRAVLATVAGLLPAGVRPVLMGDRFYGTPDLIAWCRRHGWHWRLRLKQDLLVFEDGGETTVAECFARGEHLLSGIALTEKRVATHVAMVHEPGHPEPWIIALSEAPTVHRAFDYGLRWGIEAMFSDLKTRGFGLEDSHIQRPERLSRLILVMALALLGAVSTGMWDRVHNATPDEKKCHTGAPATSCAA